MFPKGRPKLSEADFGRRAYQNWFAVNVMAVFDHQLKKAIVVVAVKDDRLTRYGHDAGAG